MCSTSSQRTCLVMHEVKSLMRRSCTHYNTSFISRVCSSNTILHTNNSPVLQRYTTYWSDYSTVSGSWEYLLLNRQVTAAAKHHWYSICNHACTCNCWSYQSNHALRNRNFTLAATVQHCHDFSIPNIILYLQCLKRFPPVGTVPMLAGRRECSPPRVTLVSTDYWWFAGPDPELDSAIFPRLPCPSLDHLKQLLRMKWKNHDN